jgi:hypothetical protein
MPTEAQVRAKAAEVAALASEKFLQPFREARDLSLSMAGQIPSVPGGSVPVQIPVPIPVPWDEAVTMADLIVADITSEFEWFTRPDPALVRSMMSSVLAIRGESSPNPASSPLMDSRLGLMQSVWDAVGDWHGDAATMFKDNYIARFADKRANHMMLVVELALALQAFEGIIAGSRPKVVEIGDKTILRLASLPTGGLSDAVMLTIAAGVVGLLGAAVPGLGVPLAFIGGGLGVAAQWADEHRADPPDTYIQGGTVEAVVQSMKDAIVLLKQDVANAQQLLSRAMAHDEELMALENAKAQANRDHNNYFYLIRPDVTGSIGAPATDFSC